MKGSLTGTGISKKQVVRPELQTVNPIQHEGGPYGPHTEELPDNSELARAGGPSFGDF